MSVGALYFCGGVVGIWTAIALESVPVLVGSVAAVVIGWVFLDAGL